MMMMMMAVPVQLWYSNSATQTIQFQDRGAVSCNLHKKSATLGFQNVSPTFAGLSRTSQMSDLLLFDFPTRSSI
jgi:hypothetical protein